MNERWRETGNVHKRAKVYSCKVRGAPYISIQYVSVLRAIEERGKVRKFLGLVTSEMWRKIHQIVPV